MGSELLCINCFQTFPLVVSPHLTRWGGYICKRCWIDKHTHILTQSKIIESLSENLHAYYKLSYN